MLKIFVRNEVCNSLWNYCGPWTECDSTFFYITDLTLQEPFIFIGSKTGQEFPHSSDFVFVLALQTVSWNPNSWSLVDKEYRLYHETSTLVTFINYLYNIYYKFYIVFWILENTLKDVLFQRTSFWNCSYCINYRYI